MFRGYVSGCASGMCRRKNVYCNKIFFGQGGGGYFSGMLRRGMFRGMVRRGSDVPPYSSLVHTIVGSIQISIYYTYADTYRFILFL